MLGRAAGILIAALAFVPAAHAGPHRCSGIASDAAGNSVSVGITLKMGVEIRSIEANWTLRPVGADRGDRWTDLRIGYQQVTLDALGPPTSINFNFGDLGRLNFDGFFFSLDGGRIWEAGYTNRMFSQIAVRPSSEWYHPAEPSVDPNVDEGLNAGLMNLLEDARTGQMQLHSPTPGGSRTVDFDLSDHAGRDALFARAMGDARGKMKTVRKDCPEAYGGPPE